MCLQKQPNKHIRFEHCCGWWCCCYKFSPQTRVLHIYLLRVRFNRHKTFSPKFWQLTLTFMKLKLYTIDALKTIVDVITRCKWPKHKQSGIKIKYSYYVLLVIYKYPHEFFMRKCFLVYQLNSSGEYFQSYLTVMFTYHTNNKCTNVNNIIWHFEHISRYMNSLYKRIILFDYQSVS